MIFDVCNTGLGNKMELSDIGKELKEARERQGLSLEKAYEDTRIGINFLQSLEQGKIEHLSHPVYAKGFVRSYARYLGLDSDRMAEDFAGVFKTEEYFEKLNPDDLPVSLKTSRYVPGSSWYSTALIIIPVLAVVLGLGWFFYSSYFSGKDELEQVASFHESAPDTVAPGPVVSPAPERAQGPPSDDVQPDTGMGPDTERVAGDLVLLRGPEPADEPVTNGTPARPGENNSVPEPEQPPVADDQASAVRGEPAADEDEAISEPGRSVLVIQARDECWTRVVADDSRRDVHLRPGESASYEFEDFARITLGNAGRVDIFLDGRPYPFEASSGEVKTLTVYPSGNTSN
jgi:cytoskeleton protein RodZ